MKRSITALLTVLSAILIAAAIPTEAEAAIYADTVRLHILANSDSDADQALKLEVRDEVLREYGEKLKCEGDKLAAAMKIEELLPEIESFIEEEIKKRGFDYRATARLSEEWYDTREYESFTLPAGIYTSLIIELGEGAGRNWWCVMFPPLCLDIATENAPHDDALIDYTRDEISLIGSEKYKIKFKLLELASGVFK